MRQWTIRREAARWTREVARAGLVRGTSGNVSVRVGDGFLITPAGLRLADVGPRDLVLVSAGVAVGAGRASSEAGMHAEIYGARPDVHAVVHTHSPHATAVAGLVTGGPEGVALASIGAHRPGSKDLASACARALAEGVRAVLAEQHGVVAAGGSLPEAVGVAELVEEWAEAEYLRLLLERSGHS